MDAHVFPSRMPWKAPPSVAMLQVVNPIRLWWCRSNSRRSPYRLRTTAPSPSATLPGPVAGEFQLALALAPCCYGLAAPYARKVMAFDSSLSGFGVSYRAAPPPVLAELSARIERHGSWTAFETDAQGLVSDARISNRLDLSVAQLTANWLLSD